MDRRQKLVKIFGERAVDEQLKHLVWRRGLSILTDEAFDELRRSTHEEARRRQRANARNRAIHAERAR